jgi:hypothetical protein
MNDIRTLVFGLLSIIPLIIFALPIALEVWEHYSETKHRRMIEELEAKRRVSKHK